MRKFVKLGVLAMGLMAAPALAQDAPDNSAPLNAAQTPPETRIGEKDFTSPPATLDQLDWLVGQWAGEGIQGAPAMESWLPPAGGTMVGTFVQEREDEDGPMKIMFTEHMYISEEDGSLALKLKHFNADMTGWEEKDDFLTFRLVAIEDCAVYFNALTLRCLDRDNPGSGIVAAVRMKSDKPEPQELIFRLQAFTGTVEVEPDNCAEAYTTLEMNECHSGLLEQADLRRSEYLRAALERHKDRPDLTAKITASDAAFTTYRDNSCGAVYEKWKDGSIRGIMSLTCRIDMTDKRTKTIWENWLTYADSTPALLPEPEPTR